MRGEKKKTMKLSFFRLKQPFVSCGSSSSDSSTKGNNNMSEYISRGEILGIVLRVAALSTLSYFTFKARVLLATMDVN